MNHTTSRAAQRYFSQHSLVQKEGELSHLNAIAKRIVPEPFRKIVGFRRPLVPVTFQSEVHRAR